jgi:predicted DCC family thiol-disulfide oxidoreductase YuxK
MAIAKNFLLYDGDCPFCSNYVRMLQLQKAVGPIDLLNMRDHPDLAVAYKAQGYDLNQGMLLHLDGQDYWGADCINSVNAAVFRNPCLSTAFYPFMRTGRSLALTLLGKKKMQM